MGKKVLNKQYRKVLDNQEKNKYRKFYKEQYEFCEELMSALLLYKLICVNASVKSGKRIMKEILSVMSPPNYKFYYISAFKRKELHEQHLSLEEVGIAVYAKNEYESHMIPDIKKWIGFDKKNVAIMLHDESDYGTEINQNIHKCMEYLLQEPQVKFVSFSATQEEMLCSTFVDKDDVKIVNYKPHKYYRGSDWFLKQDMIKQIIFEPEPFFSEDEYATFSEQGLEAIDYLKDSDQTFGIVRFGKQSNTIKKQMESNFPVFKKEHEELGVIPVMIGCTKNTDVCNNFYWGKDVDKFINQKNWSDLLTLAKRTGKKILLYVDQMFTRSTECGFHEHIAFYHDAGSTNLTAAIQRYGRMNHYDKNGFTIRLYVNKHVLEYDAKWKPSGYKHIKDNKEDYITNAKTFADNMEKDSFYAKSWDISGRVKKYTSTDNDHLIPLVLDMDKSTYKDMTDREKRDYHVELALDYKMDLDPKTTIKDFKRILSNHTLSAYDRKDDVGSVLETLAFGGLKKAASHKKISVFDIPKKDELDKTARSLQEEGKHKHHTALVNGIRILNDLRPEYFGKMVVVLKTAPIGTKRTEDVKTTKSVYSQSKRAKKS